MSLLDNAMTEFAEIETTVTPDGLGGYTTEYTEGGKFKAAVRFDNSTQGKIAAAQGVTSLYTIITRKDYVLYYHDVIRRLSDGKIFRITSDGDDKATPQSASLNMRSVSAEEWSLADMARENEGGVEG